MSAITDRIVMRKTELRLRQTDIIEATGASKGTVSKWISGLNDPSTEFIPALAKVLQTSEAWLINGLDKPDVTNITNVHPGVAKMAPVLSWVQAGNFTNVQAVDMSQVEEWLPLPDDCDACFYLKVQGLSNYPMFQEGDYILVDPTVHYCDVQSGDMIVVRNSEGATFKKLVIETNNVRYLQALNPDFKPNIIPLDEDCIYIGEVIDSVRYIYKSKKKNKVKHS